MYGPYYSITWKTTKAANGTFTGTVMGARYRADGPDKTLKTIKGSKTRAQAKSRAIKWVHHFRAQYKTKKNPTRTRKAVHSTFKKGRLPTKQRRLSHKKMKIVAKKVQTKANGTLHITIGSYNNVAVMKRGQTIASRRYSSAASVKAAYDRITSMAKAMAFVNRNK